jgi:hypothetical protein
MSHLRIALLGLLFSLGPLSGPAAAQSVGTFRWQLQPYCNVLTLRVVQQGGIYTLDGTDDLCGANQSASVVGIASLNANGSVGFGLSLVLPGGTPVHIDASINMSSLNGTWRDSAGNSGSLTFTPGPSVPGEPRPVPKGGIAPASITLVQMAPNSVSGANVVDGSITTADIFDAPRAVFDGGDQFITLSGSATIARTVTITAPTAGRVILNASGYFWFLTTGTIEEARCSITPETSVDTRSLIIASEATADSTLFVPFAGTRAFDVGPGNIKFNLVCDQVRGAVGLSDTNLNALFVANTP